MLPAPESRALVPYHLSKPRRPYVEEERTLASLGALDIFVETNRTTLARTVLIRESTGDDRLYNTQLIRYKNMMRIDSDMSRWLDEMSSSPNPHVARWSKRLDRFYYSPEDVEYNLMRDTAHKHWRRLRTQLTFPDGSKANAHELDSALDVEENPESRRKLYLNLHETNGKLLPLVFKLRDLQNNMARSQGYDNYFEYKLSGYNLKPIEVEQLLAEVWTIIKPVDQQRVEALRSFATGRELHPWDLPYLSTLWKREQVRTISESAFEDQLGIVKRVISQLGLRAGFDKLTIDEGNRQGKGSPSCITINPPHEFGIILGKAEKDARSLAVFFEEIGHGLHSSFISPSHPNVMRRIVDGSDLVWAEAMGSIFVNLMAENGVLNLDLSSRSDFEAWRVASLAQRLASLVACMIRLDFEKNFYASDTNNPSELSRIWYKSNRKYNPIWESIPFDNIEEVHPWVNDHYLVEKPVDTLSYVLADLYQVQIETFARAHYNPLISTDLGFF